MNIGQLIDQTAERLTEVIRGGPGSGHHGHEGRPGEVGGSLPDTATAESKILATEHRTEWENTRQRMEQQLIDNYGEAEWDTGIWIGPSGKFLAPFEDHQKTALELMGWEADLMTHEGMVKSSHATDEVIKQGIVRYNLMEAEAYFDIPSMDEVTDIQWVSMAIAVKRLNRDIVKRYGENAKAGVIITIGAFLQETVGERFASGREAYEWLGLEEDYDYGVFRGGPGSGHFEHAGRPGEVGGSKPATAISKPQAADKWKRLWQENEFDFVLSIDQFISESMSENAGRSIDFFDDVIGHHDGKDVSGFKAQDQAGNELIVQWGIGEIDDRKEIWLSYIRANNKGTGLGTAYMESAKRLADTMSLPFRVLFVSNHDFYRRFDWLTPTNYAESWGQYRNFIYEPNQN